MNSLIQRLGFPRLPGRSKIPIMVLAIMVSLVFALQSCTSGDSGGGKSESSAARKAAKDSETGEPKPSEKSGMMGTEATGPSELTGDTIEIRKSWTQIRSAPDFNARAIGLAFGNDKYPVTGKEGDWVRVRMSRNRDGWIPAEDTDL